MFIKMNARNQIVEATDSANGDGYTEFLGTVADNLPRGLLGFNGTVYTPVYEVVDGIVTERTAEDKARDPYSDESPTAEERIAALEEIITAQAEALAELGVTV